MKRGYFFLSFLLLLFNEAFPNFFLSFSFFPFSFSFVFFSFFFFSFLFFSFLFFPSPFLSHFLMLPPPTSSKQVDMIRRIDQELRGELGKPHHWGVDKVVGEEN